MRGAFHSVRPWLEGGFLLLALVAAGCGDSGSRHPGSVNHGPRITSISPSGGEPEGGEIVVITTEDFQDDFMIDVPEVIFGKDSVSVTPLNSNSVEVLSPAHPEVAVTVVVKGTGIPERAVLRGAFTYEETTGWIGAMSRSVGDISGHELVQIYFREFRDDFQDHPPLVLFGKKPARVVDVRTESGPTYYSGYVYVESPSHREGAVTIRVQSADYEEKAILWDGFTYVDIPPWIAKPDCSYGGTAGGDTIYIRTGGYKDDFRKRTPIVLFGDVPATVIGVHWGRLEVLTGPHPEGIVDVMVQGSGKPETVVFESAFSYREGSRCEFYPPYPCGE